MNPKIKINYKRSLDNLILINQIRINGYPINILKNMKPIIKRYIQLTLF